MSRLRLPAAVITLGVVSLLTDVSSEMIFPLLPIFLVGTLKADATFLGLVEGAADTIASLVKLGSGYLADRLPRRKPLVAVGYGLAGAVRPLVALATAPWHVLAVRLTDRFGKGTRAAPRDAMIADAADPREVGRAFGFHRAMDHAGAMVGPLLAAALLYFGTGLRTVFALAAIPAAVAFLAVLSVGEEARPRTAAASVGTLPGRLRSYLGIVLVFSLGNSSDAFLLLRASDLGVSTAAVPLLWTVHHVVKVVCSYAGGSLSDRVPRVRLVLGGWVIYAAVYGAFAMAHAAWHAWALFMVYGVYYGLTEPAEKAMVKDLAPETVRGRAFGYYHLVLGISALPAGLFTGWLWHRFSPGVALGTCAGCAALAAAAIGVWSRRAAAAVATPPASSPP